MTQFLPPNLLALFAPREPIKYIPPTERLPFEKRTKGYSGVASYLNLFEDPKDTPPPMKIENREERLERKKREKQEQAAYRLEQGIALWDPQNNEMATTDPYKTLFVARMNYDTSESKLRREFETYGEVKKVTLVHDKVSEKPRGYAFVEFAQERDMHSCYKHADGKKIDGRRVLVDVERGRTVKGWLPRRLGGGLGGTRRGGPDENAKHSGREDNNRTEESRDRGERSDSRRGEREGRSRDRDRSDRRRSVDRDRKRKERSRSPRNRDKDRERERPERAERESRGSERESRDRPEREGRDKEKDKDRSERRSRRERVPSTGVFA